MFKNQSQVPFLIAVIVFLCAQNVTVFAQSVGTESPIVFTQGSLKKNFEHIFLLQGIHAQPKQLTATGRNYWPKWSPDKKWIVFASSGQKTHKNREIYLMDANGENQIRLTETEKGNSIDPRWSSDGKMLYFTSAMKGLVQENIVDLELCRIQGAIDMQKSPKLIGCVRSSDGNSRQGSDAKVIRYEKKVSELRNIALREKNIFEIFPSPDGAHLALYFVKTGVLELCDAVGNRIKTLKTQFSGRPAWSKDGKKIAFSDGSPPEQILTIYDVQKDHYDKTKFGMNSEIGCGGAISWNRDTKHIMYACGTPFSEDNNSWIYIFDLQSKKSIRLIEGNSPDW